MLLKRNWLWVGVAVVLCLGGVGGGGCKQKSGPEGAPANPEPKGPPPRVRGSIVETVARVHWLGKKRIAAETNSAKFMDIWKLPQSLMLEQHVLDQFSLAPWRLLPGNTNFAVTNVASALLRPLLDDAAQEEWYAEVSSPTNAPPEVAFAIRLNDERARLWQTNLTVVFASLSSASLAHHPRLQRAGEWLVAGLGSPTNVLVENMLVRVNRDHVPYAPQPTNFWVEAYLDPPRVARALATGATVFDDLPKIYLTMIGDGQNVRTHADLNFANPLPFELEPWNIPTNLIPSSLYSFTAIRGMRPWLSSLKSWMDLAIGEPPNQVFCWGNQSAPFMTYCAFPLPKAGNIVSNVTEFLLKEGNPWLVANASGEFLRSTVADGLTCTAGAPMMGPILRSAADGPNGFVLAGFNPLVETRQSAPDWLIRELAGHPNVAFYEREVTGPRIGAWLYLSQALRVIFWKAQLPFESASIGWFKAVTPVLGNCTTTGLKTGPAQLTFNRNSSVGLNSVELHLLADWLESPHFPRGINTLEAKGIGRRKAASQTNAVPATVPGAK